MKSLVSNVNLLLVILSIGFALLAMDAFRWRVTRRDEEEFIEKDTLLDNSQEHDFKQRRQNLLSRRRYGIGSTHLLPWLFSVIALVLAVIALS